MEKLLKLFTLPEFTLSYWLFVLITSGLIYKFFSMVGDLLRENHKDKLALWLSGKYRSSWTIHFCRMFDRVFTDQHFSLTCFFRSCIASLLAVSFIYILFGPVLGLLQERAEFETSFITIIILGVIINLIPDYISLFQTRWILKYYSRTDNVGLQLLILIADLVITGAIISLMLWFLQLTIFSNVKDNLTHTWAILNGLSIFFYSTFLTSIWAWLYCAGAWFIKLYLKLPFNYLFNIEKEAPKVLGLAVSLLYIFITILISPLVFSYKEKTGGINPIDSFWCKIDSTTCKAFADSIEDDKEKLKLLIAGCTNGDTELCIEQSMKMLNTEEYKDAIVFLHTGCDEGDLQSCAILGNLYYAGLGVVKDLRLALTYSELACKNNIPLGCVIEGLVYFDNQETDSQKTIENKKKAFDLFEKACLNDGPVGCQQLALMYDNGEVVEQNFSKAIEYYDLACQSKQLGRSCVRMAQLYNRGQGTKQDYKKAAHGYQIACSQGLTDACNALGKLHTMGLGVDKDDLIAAGYFLYACEKGDPEACGSVGYMYENGLGLSKTKERAAFFYRKTCDSAYYRGCIKLGRLYENNESQMHIQQGINIATQACHSNEALACLFLARIYEEGEIIEQDKSEADNFYTKTFTSLQHYCGKGDMNACASLGSLYLEGPEEHQDLKQAISLYESACSTNLSSGCLGLGEIYKNKKYEVYNLHTAWSYFERACDLLDQACTQLAIMHEEGKINNRNYQAAERGYTKACNAGSALACSKLGEIYELGKGYPIDINRAVAFYQKSCDMGWSKSCESVQRIKNAFKN